MPVALGYYSFSYLLSCLIYAIGGLASLSLLSYISLASSNVVSGEYFFLSSLASLLSTLILQGSPMQITRIVASSDSTTYKMLLLALRRLTRLVLVPTFFCFLAFLVYLFLSSLLTPLPFLLFAWIIISAFQLVVVATLRGLHKNKVSEGLQLLAYPLISLALLVLLSKSTRIEVSTFALLSISLVSTAACCTLSFIQLLQQLHPVQNDCQEDPDFESKLNYYLSSKELIPCAASQLQSVLYSQSPLLLLGILGFTANVGFYKIASSISAYLMLPFNGLLLYASPLITRNTAENTFDNVQGFLRRGSLFTVLIMSFLLFVFCCVGYPFFLKIFGSHMKQAFSLSILISTLRIFQIASGPCSLFLELNGKSRVVTMIAFPSLILSCIASLLAHYFWGLTGFAVSFGLVHAASAWFLSSYVSSEYNIRISV
jgi:O-antigen/teichoic acid export membrane protein